MSHEPGSPQGADPREGVDLVGYFGDRVNSLFGAVQGNIEYLRENPQTPDRAEVTRETQAAWKQLFTRLDDFVAQDFKPTGALTKENIDRLRAMRHDDILQSGVYERALALVKFMRGEGADPDVKQ